MDNTQVSLLSATIGAAAFLVCVWAIQRRNRLTEQRRQAERITRLSIAKAEGRS